jgi:hypothetical protein
MRKKIILGMVLLFILLLSFNVLGNCIDGIDNDRDGYTDLNDAGCLDARDASEREYGLQLYVAEDIDETRFDSLVEDYGEQCVTDNLYSMTWLITYYRPLPRLQSCLEDNNYYGLVYDDSLWYSNLALADCVYENIDIYDTVVETVWARDTVGANADEIKEYCMEVHYNSYSELYVPSCDDVICDPFLCDSVTGTCYEECSDDSTCLESAACVTTGSDDFGECLVCSGEGGDIFTAGDDLYGVNSAGFSAISKDRCNTADELREYSCEEVEGHLYLGSEIVTCSDYGSAGCTDGACEELLSEGEICTTDIQCLTGICHDDLGTCTSCEVLTSYFDCHSESACGWTGTCVMLEGLTCPDLATAGECSSKIEECNWDTSVGGCVDTLEPDCTTWEDCVEGVSTCSNAGFCLACENTDSDDEYTAGVYSGVDALSMDEISGTEACVDSTTVEEYECESDSTLILSEIECPSDHVCETGACVEGSSSNTPPVIEDVSGVTAVIAPGTIVLNVEATDVDGDILTYTFVNSVLGIDYTGSSNSYSWDATVTDVGSYDILITVSDGLELATWTQEISVIDGSGGSEETAETEEETTGSLDCEVGGCDCDSNGYVEDDYAYTDESWDAREPSVCGFDPSDDWRAACDSQAGEWYYLTLDESGGESCAFGLESEVLPKCNDGLDNDGDGSIDYPTDDGCDSKSDDSEFSMGGGPMGAAELEQEPGLVLKLWDWLTFWN